MTELNLDEATIQADLFIDDSSMFALETSLKTYPSTLEKYSRMASQAIKEVDKVTMELEIVTAELIDELCQLYQAKEGKAFPPSGISEVRRSFVPLCRRWKKKKIELHEVTETMNIIKGALKAYEARGFKTQELFKIALKRLFGENTAGYKSEG